MSDSDISRERTFEKYSVDGGDLQGRVTASEGRRIIELFKPADASTAMHLFGDLWFDEMVHDASLPYAPESIKNDLQIVLDWLGVRTAKDIGTEQRQQWARFRAIPYGGKSALRFPRFQLQVFPRAVTNHLRYAGCARRADHRWNSRRV